MKRSSLLFVSIGALCIAVYWGIWNIYFQQDEWNGFGNVLYAQTYGYTSLIRLYGSHLTPLTSLFFALLYKLFAFNHRYYALYSIFLHLLNVLLLYCYAYTISKNKRIALLASTIFATALVSQQAVTWFAASASFLPAASFTLLSLLYFEKILQKPTLLYGVLTYLCLFLSLGFRENSVILFFYFILRSLLYRYKYSLYISIISTVSFVFYAALRFIPHVLNTPHQIMGTSTQLNDYIIHATELIGLSIPQLIIPRVYMLQIAYPFYNMFHIFFTYSIGVSNSAVFVETKLLRGLYLLFFIVFTSIFTFIYRKSIWHSRYRTVVLSLIIFLIFSILPFTFLPRKLPMESRHFYIPVIPFTILFSIVSHVLLKQHSSIIKGLLVCTVSAFIIMNIYGIRMAMHKAISISMNRIDFIKQLNNVYPSIPSRSIFYSQGDHPPFQSGFGHLLMVVLHNRQPYESFLKNNFLWNIKAQGYAEMDTIGFGYFYEIESLNKTYCIHRLNPSNVFSFTWNNRDKHLADTSEVTRSTLDCPVN